MKGDQLTNIDVNRKIIHGIINIYFLFTIPIVSKTRKIEFIIAVVSSIAYHEISRHFSLEPTKGHTAQCQFGDKPTSKEIQIILRLFLVITMYCQAS